MPSLKELELARRRQTSKAKGSRPDFQLDCAASWDSFVQEKLRRNQDDVAAYEFKYFRLVEQSRIQKLRRIQKLQVQKLHVGFRNYVVGFRNYFD